jgi:hypothetical protein
MRKNLRYRQSVINKKLNYLKNIDSFGVSYPIPFKHNSHYAIYEDPFDEFIFANNSVHLDDYYLANNEESEFNYIHEDKIVGNRNSLNSETNSEATDEYDTGRLFVRYGRVGRDHPYDLVIDNYPKKINFLKDKRLNVLDFFKEIKKYNKTKKFFLRTTDEILSTDSFDESLFSNYNLENFYKLSNPMRRLSNNYLISGKYRFRKIKKKYQEILKNILVQFQKKFNFKNFKLKA